MTIDLTNDDAEMADVDVFLNDDDQKDIDPPNDQNTNTDTTTSTSLQIHSVPQFKYVWQWVENDGTWHDYDATTQLLLDALSIGNKITITAGRWTYDITKTSNTQCSQKNVQTQNV